MKVETLYDPGTATYREDLSATKSFDGFEPPVLLAAVFDGVSGLYVPSEGPRLFEVRGKKITGGQVVCRIASSILSNVQPEENLESILIEMNASLKWKAKNWGFFLEQSDIIPGAAFAAAKIDDETVEIIQGADCFAVWLFKYGTIGATPNQLFRYERKLRRVITRLMKKHSGNRNEMWKEFIPIVSEARLRHVNKRGGYALLNGQAEVRKIWQHYFLLRDEIEMLLLFTDGLVPFKDTEEPESLGKMVVNFYRKGGLREILKRARRIEAKEATTSHIDQAEATAIAIEL